MRERSAHGTIHEGQDSDRELVDRVVAGDREAFTPLLQRYQRKILNFMYRMIGKRDVAEDLTQEVFLKAYEALPRFRKEAAFSTWLFRIAHNHCVNSLKRTKREIPMAALEKDPPNGNPLARLADPSPSTEQNLEQRELRAIIQEKLAEITLEHRAVLILRDVQGLSYDEIASTLELEGGTVRSRIHRARMELKEKLRSYLEA